MLKKLCSMTAVSRGASERSGMLSSEKGVALVLVLVLSAVALVFMTALLHMLTAGTKVSGLQKKYKTALDAGEGGANIVYQLLATRAEPAALASLNTVLDAALLNYTPTTPLACRGTVGAAATPHFGLEAKLLTSSTSWDTTTCDRSLNIDPNIPSTYDMRIQLGADAPYNVFAKIVATVDGNTGGDPDLLNNEVVNSNTGEVKVAPIPYIYAIEVLSVNNARIDERAKLSVLYQY